MNDKMYYQYKCRMCGDIECYEAEPTDNPEMDIEYSVTSGEKIRVHWHLTGTHYCSNGGIGVADLIGCGPEK